MLKKWKKILVIVAVQTMVFFSLGGTVATKIKMVIIGDSMTIPKKGASPWPKYLQPMVADKYEIVNKAVNGRTMIAVGWKGNQSQWPYVTTKEWKQVFEEKPHMISIMLGSNDTKPIHWVESGGKERFKSDYLNMLDTLYENIEAEPFSGDIPIKPKFVLLYPPVVKGGVCWGGKTHHICDTITKKHLIPLIREVAEEWGADTVNIDDKNTNNLFAERNDVYSDGLHFNDKGATEMAEFLAPFYKEIKMEDFVGCKDTNYQEYSPKASTNDQSQCKTKKATTVLGKMQSDITIKTSPAAITVLSPRRVKLNLMDLKGRLLRQSVSNPTSGSLSTAGLVPGVYLLRISTERDSFTRKVFTGE